MGFVFFYKYIYVIKFYLNDLILNILNLLIVEMYFNLKCIVKILCIVLF